MSDWQPISTAPQLQVVLVHYKNVLGKSRVIKARFTPRYTEEATDECEFGTQEYDEANDRYTLVEGWWECIDNWGDFSYVFVTEGVPDHWMPLPKPPTHS